MCPSADSRPLTGPANGNARARHSVSDFLALSIVFITAAPTRSRRRWRSTISAEGRGIQGAHKSFALPLLSSSRHMAFLQRRAPHSDGRPGSKGAASTPTAPRRCRIPPGSTRNRVPVQRVRGTLAAGPRRAAEGAAAPGWAGARGLAAAAGTGMGREPERAGNGNRNGNGNRPGAGTGRAGGAGPLPTQRGAEPRASQLKAELPASHGWR